MIERQADLALRDGACTTFVVHPERDGPHPVVVMFMDAPGIREELRDMARRIAAVGYFVMLPNMYYREGVMELPLLPAKPTVEERAPMMRLMHSLDIPMVMRDTADLLAWAAHEPAARADVVGCVGYCMSGQYAVNAAVRFPGQVRAAASYYGTALVTDGPDSPHRVAARTRAELYFAMAENDMWVPPEVEPQLRAALAADKVDAEVELYPGTQHGFAFPLRPGYDRDAAERHWERLFALFRRRLA